jgi:putative transposase
MPRAPRDQAPGHFHVTTRGNDGRGIYRTAADRHVFIALLNRVVRKLIWRVDAWCLLSNHYHLVVVTRDPNLSAGMQRLNGEYAKLFNACYGHTGHLFERRFWSKRIHDDEQLLAAGRYILENPVKAGLCAEPWDWRWLGGPLLARVSPPPRH